MKRKSKGNPYLSKVVCWMMVGMMVLALVWPDRSFSSVENRPLARSASFSSQSLMSGKTGRELNTVFTDQFPGRDLFFHLDYLFRKGCGQREIKDVFLGKNALLANPEAQNGSTLTDTIGAINTFASLNGLSNYLLVSPSAATIQSEKLPDHAPVREIDSAFNQIAVSTPNVITVDARQILDAHNKEYLFYKTDHHWTSLGAGYAAQSLLEAMDIEMDLADFNRMPVSNSFQGTLASKTGSPFLKDRIELAVSDQNPRYYVTWADGTKTSSIYNRQALKTKDQYQVFLAANQALVRIDTDVNTTRSLLLFKDSYANSVVQYLLPYFSSITIVDPRYYYEDLELVLGSDLFTDCVFLYSYDTFVTIPALKNVLNAWNAKHPIEP